jgi:hypothetical protein
MVQNQGTAVWAAKSFFAADVGIVALQRENTNATLEIVKSCAVDYFSLVTFRISISKSPVD